MDRELFQITVVRPEGDAAAEALRATAELLFHAMRRLGLPVRLDQNSVLEDGTNIVFGAHLLAPEMAASLPAGSIVFNTEPLARGGPMVEAMRPFVERFRVWDYDPRNARAIVAMGSAVRVQVLRAGWIPELERVVHRPDKDIDVLFYGEMSPHRAHVIDRLQASGQRVAWLRGVYRDARDAWIARSRLVLNLHYQPGAPFEMGRVAYLLANRCAVVSEVDGPDAIDADLRDGIAAVSAPAIPARCAMLLADATAREALAARGQAAFRARDFCATLREALAQRAAA